MNWQERRRNRTQRELGNYPEGAYRNEKERVLAAEYCRKTGLITVDDAAWLYGLGITWPADQPAMPAVQAADKDLAKHLNHDDEVIRKTVEQHAEEISKPRYTFGWDAARSGADHASYMLAMPDGTYIPVTGHHNHWYRDEHRTWHDIDSQAAVPAALAKALELMWQKGEALKRTRLNSKWNRSRNRDEQKEPEA